MDPTSASSGRSTDLPGLLGGWSDGHGPLNEQLAGAISGLIRRGELGPGDRLPSERDLAEGLGVSRTTVVSAYDRLRTDGIIRSRRGSGSRVAPGVEPSLDISWVGAVPSFLPGRLGARSGSVPGERFIPSGSSDPIALTIGALRGWSGVREVIEDTVREDLDEVLDDYGYLPFGLPALRSAVARMLSVSGVPTDSDQILITGGGQQAIHLLVDQLAGPEGVVAIEDPTYIGALDAIRAVGACTVPVPVGPDGVRIDVLTRSMASVSPAFLYVVPTFHNPTGAVMPDANRRALAELAVRRDLIVVEDLSPETTVSQRMLPPIASYAPRQVITIGSLSKGGWGGLRIGWIRAEQRLITRLAARKATFDHGSPTLTQAIAVRMLARGDEFGERAERESNLRRGVAAEALREFLPDWRWTMPQGGLSFWVLLPDGDAVAFSRVAAEHGVLVRSGPAASPQGGFRDHLRIAVGEEPERLREGIKRLADAWQECSPASSRRMDSVLSVSV
jgi:DNA-binding transcriptional MocR family regulator